jgi:small nuclear ribonucleoprotein (snRNP)-like protein
MSEDNFTAHSSPSETFDSVMERRLMRFTADSLGQEVKVKLRGSLKQYSGVLHAIDPSSFAIIIQNFSGADERAEFKVIQLGQLEYLIASNCRTERKQ